jgi:hypothetical protein
MRVAIAQDYNSVRDRIYVSEYLKNGITISLGQVFVGGEIYKYTSPINYVTYINRIIFTIIDSKFPMNDIGGEAEMVNGFEFYYKTTAIDSKNYIGATNDIPITKNGSITNFSHDFVEHKPEEKEEGQISWKYNVEEVNVPIRLEAGGLIAMESLGIDDISGVSEFYVHIQGYRVLDSIT